MRNTSLNYLAWRFLKGRSRWGLGRGNYLTLLGIALGVTALICVSSVMNGFREDMQMRIIGTLSELRISPPAGQKLVDYESTIAQCEALGFYAAPVLRQELILRRGSLMEPTMSFGIDLGKQLQISRVLQPLSTEGANKVKQGIIGGSINSEHFAQGIILGSGMAFRLGAQIGDQIQVLSPLFSQPTAFGLLPKILTLRVVAIFAAGMPEYDAMYSFIPLESSFYMGNGEEGVDYIDLKPPLVSSNDPKLLLRSVLGNNILEDWSSFDPSLYNAIRFEKVIMFVIMSFMYIIASFNLTGNMLKSISRKKKELGMLKAIGYNHQELNLLFIRQSLILTFVGLAIGIALAILLLWLQSSFGLVKLELSAMDAIALPVSIAHRDIIVVTLAAFGISMLSIIFPLRKLRDINAISLIRQNA